MDPHRLGLRPQWPLRRVSRADVGLRSERGPVLLAVMLSVGLVAIDATVLATAVPAVVEDLGGFTQFPWLFSVYLLTQAVSVPLYSKLADQYGRKPMMLVGVGIFLLGSLLCGLAWNMTSLIAFRAVQGIGAGAVQPIGMTIVGRHLLHPGAGEGAGLPRQRVGDVGGGRPYARRALLRLHVVALDLLRQPAHRGGRAVDVRAPLRGAGGAARHRIDVLGSLLLTGGGLTLLLGLLEGGVRWAWASTTSVGLFAASAVMLSAFVLVERRAREPVLPLWVFRHRVILPATLTALVVGVLLIGLTSYIPLYGQSVLGHSALMAGFALAALTLGWPLSAANAGRLYLTIGFRSTILWARLRTGGSLLLLTLDRDSSLFHLAVPCFVMGLGFGFAVAPSVIAAQSAVGWESRAVATGATMFARTVGSAIGVAVFGALVNAQVTGALGHSSPDLEHLSPAVLEPAIRTTFIGSAIVAVALVAVSLLMPRRIDSDVV